MSHALATSTSSQASVPAPVRHTNSTLKPLKFKSWLPSQTLSTTRSARPTAANALRLPTLPSPSRPRTEHSPSKVLSLYLREFTSPRERDPLRTPRASQRSRPFASLTTKTVASVPTKNASLFQFAHQASILQFLLPPSEIPQFLRHPESQLPSVTSDHERTRFEP